MLTQLGHTDEIEERQDRLGRVCAQRHRRVLNRPIGCRPRRGHDGNNWDGEQRARDERRRERNQAIFHARTDEDSIQELDRRPGTARKDTGLEAGHSYLIQSRRTSNEGRKGGADKERRRQKRDRTLTVAIGSKRGKVESRRGERARKQRCKDGSQAGQEGLAEPHLGDSECDRRSANGEGCTAC